MPPKKDKQDRVVLSPDDMLNQEISEAGLGSLVKLVEECPDIDVECVSTGFPQLDYILHPIKRGFPLSRDIEIYSRDPECGKTSLALEFVRAAQARGLKTVYADVEKTLTAEFLRMNRIAITPGEAPDKYALRVLRHEDEARPAEEFLDAVRMLGRIVDVIDVDSVAALEKRANLEKTSEDRNQIGSLALLLSDFFKKNVSKKAAVIWINQMRTAIGAYSPTGSTPLKPTGGKALGFYASIRLELSVVDKVRESREGDPVGMKVRIFTAKNKIAPQWRQCVLTYLFGYGFSPAWDYMEVGLSRGIVLKKGAWLSFENWKAQGPLNFHNQLLANPDMFERLKEVVEGRELVEANAGEAEAHLEVLE